MGAPKYNYNFILDIRKPYSDAFLVITSDDSKSKQQHLLGKKKSVKHCIKQLKFEEQGWLLKAVLSIKIQLN